MLFRSELIAAVLLLARCHAWLGALLALGVMGGAIMSHLTKLGIVVQDDGGLLFALAVVVSVTSGVTAFLHRNQIPFLPERFKSQKA